MTKALRDNRDINIVQQTSCEHHFLDVQMQLTMYFFVPPVRPYMHHNYGVLSGSYACRVCVWPIILDAELYTTCPGSECLLILLNARHQSVQNSKLINCVGARMPTFLWNANIFSHLERGSRKC